MELDHIGVAVRSIEAAGQRWARLLGPADGAAEEVGTQGVRVAFYRSGPSHVELLEPTRPDAAVARFLERRGEGLHHLAFRVPSVDSQLAELVGRGERVVDRAARPGARGRRVGFAHPEAYGGVLVEFVEGP